MDFCTDFDRQLAKNGPAAVFLPDRKGLLRMNPQWTRDVWEHAPTELPIKWTWTLMRDTDTHYVTFALVTSPKLIETHAKMDIRSYDSEEEATQALAEFGSPPLALQPW